MDAEQQPPPPPPPLQHKALTRTTTMRRVSYSASASASSSTSFGSEEEELRSMMPVPTARKPGRRHLSKQLSMQETSREASWERRRRQRMTMEHARLDPEGSRSSRSLTDEDLDELKGSIDLGFGFKEEDGQELCGTLPALDLYFAVNRQLSDSKHRLSSVSSLSTASTPCGGSTSSIGDQSTDSPRSPHPHHDPWKICNPGDDPQHVKTRLRHWAQAVACSVRQFS